MLSIMKICMKGVNKNASHFFIIKIGFCSAMKLSLRRTLQQHNIIQQ